MARCPKTTKAGDVQCNGGEGHAGPCFVGGVVLADFDRIADARRDEKMLFEMIRRARECTHVDQACQLVYFINDTMGADAPWRSSVPASRVPTVAWRENRLSFRDGLTRLGQLGLSVEQAAQLLVKT